MIQPPRFVILDVGHSVEVFRDTMEAINPELGEMDALECYLRDIIDQLYDKNLRAGALEAYVADLVDTFELSLSQTGATEAMLRSAMSYLVQALITQIDSAGLYDHSQHLLYAYHSLLGFEPVLEHFPF